MPKKNGCHSLDDTRQVIDGLHQHYLEACELYVSDLFGESDLEKELFKQFKIKYLARYQDEFFKNPLSKMRIGLLDGHISKLKEVEIYCIDHPNSRAAVVLDELYGMKTNMVIVSNNKNKNPRS